MAVFKLVKLSPIGKRDDITTGFDSESLIELAQLLQKKDPGGRFGVTDNVGFFVWPEKLARAHIPPAFYTPLVKQEYE